MAKHNNTQIKVEILQDFGSTALNAVFKKGEILLMDSYLAMEYIKAKFCKRSNGKINRVSQITIGREKATTN